MQVDPRYVTNLVGSLDQTQANEQQLTSELSSGVSITSLSQNPVGAGENVLLLNQIQQDDSFTQSSSLVTGQLQVADSALGSVVSAADAGNFAGHQRQQRHHECQRREIDRQPDLGNSRRGAIAGQHQLSGPVHFCRRTDCDGAVFDVDGDLAGGDQLQRRPGRELSGVAQRAEDSVECAGQTRSSWAAGRTASLAR